MHPIVWSEEAYSDYIKNIEFLLEKWGTNEAKNFIEEVDFVLELLPLMPEMYPLSGYKNIRKGIVCKQISLLYIINKNQIELVRFWNNYQNPKKLKKI